MAAIIASSIALAEPKAEFAPGFKALADQLPDVVGEPLENERWCANGDSLQQTTRGLMVWRKADDLTAFTDGSRTWVNGPSGIMGRGNDQRFEWESPVSAPDLESRVITAGLAEPPPSMSTPLPPHATYPTSFNPEAEELALELINQFRQQNGVVPVTMDEELRRVARAHAQDMAARRYFAHNTPEGQSTFDRMKAAGISYGWAAENLGWSKGYSSSSDAVRSNHHSMVGETPPDDGHRRILLDSRLHRVGIGVCCAADGRIYLVTDFID